MPRGGLAALERAITHRGAGVRTDRLRARYYDTASRSLAQAGIALRLRRENRRWVQTLKATGPTPLTRIELESIRPDDTLDLSLLAGTSIADRFEQALGDEPLQVVFETDIRRRARALRAGRARIEVALDIGAVIAGGRRAAVREIEFELIAGDPVAMLALAGRWRDRFGLILDPRSKAEQGDLLARGHRFAPPRKARRVDYPTSASAREALQAILFECHDHLLANVAPLAIADADGRHPEPLAAADEYVHQLRVALRRLRSALRLFDGWGIPLPATLGEAAREVFRRFGSNRDFDVICGDIAPALARSGAPPVTLHRAGDAIAPGALAREPATQHLVLSLLRRGIELMQAEAAEPEAPEPEAPEPEAPEPAPIPSPPAPAPKPFPKLASRRLAKWHASISRDGTAFLSLDDDARHRLRKRIKRQRYAIEFLAPQLKRKRTARYLRDLAAVQEVLGEYNDLVVARAIYQPISESDPQALFALGWIAARLDAVRVEAARRLARLAEREPVG